MVLSRRERTIAIAAGAAAVLLLLNYFLITPMWDGLSDAEQKLTRAQARMDDSHKTLKAGDRLSPRWKQIEKGPLKNDAYLAERQLLESVSGWAESSGLTLSSTSSSRSDRAEKETGFHRVTLRATGTGGMSQVGRFLYRVQTATIPLAISELQVTSRKEGMDDLEMRVSISTIYLSADADKPDKTPKPATTAGKESE